MKLCFFQSKTIELYKPILEGMIDVWDYEFYPTILEWCDVIGEEEKRDKYWQVWLIQTTKQVIGICGLYSLKDTTKELWLGWLGLIPEYRNKKLGKQILDFIEKQAKNMSCKKILSYVDEEGDALNFYYKNGWKWWGSVKSYIQKYPELQNEFTNFKDFIIYKDL